ncbi:EamA family transporter [Nakamurella antarctica]|uniref:EamA family transporter n=1 Tax=Nakamurella antarctica TaxID=1902245 RepID=A0A3G8ZPJ3_9ACTN|nr:EamA family transporter [Nakamurella antarctica]AZI59180.1 EamA family transporter [Nakamurella antarctica]
MTTPPVPVAEGGPAGAGSAGSGLGRWPAVAMVLGSATSTHLGAAIAVLLFARAGAGGVVTLRLAGAALIMMLICRPQVRGYRRSDWAVVIGFGVALAGMNTLFYQAIDRIPLGAAVTIEVLGPLTLSVIASRRAIAWLWAALALGGVILLGGAGFDGLNLTGVAFALGAAAAWAAYIVLSGSTGQRFPKADGLALALVVAAVLTLPLGITSSGSAMFAPAVLGLGLAVAVLSSSLPYTIELLALRALPASTFAILVSLGPGIAATAGYFILDQPMNLIDGAAIALVIAASIGAVLTTPAKQVSADIGLPVP